jgi:hydrogenase maturation protein HypF
MNQRLKIEVRGIVQGVGFRPFVYRLAHRFALTGNIRNSEAGVSIEVQGPEDDISSFLSALPAEAPPLARLIEIATTSLALQDDSAFSILASTHSGRASTLISPDIATCADCITEMLDPANRRYLYPFINCTNCGPRFTITRSVPYDRRQTSMASFTLCHLCQAEYDDPMDRRFHAQPNACWSCGPQLQLVDRTGTQQPGDPVAEAIRLLELGFIFAIKGLGGFHLAVDATRPEAVRELRRRKNRGDKPFALMVANTSAIKDTCEVTAEDAELLESPQRPIVLLRKISEIYNTLASDGNHLGVFLPYTPLHHLLVGNDGLSALVMTSGNLSDEPIAIDNDEAVSRLNCIADFFLVHNRDILLRCDDSVIRRIGNKPQFARRSRGFVPSPILLKAQVPPILAVGGELKNTISLAREATVFVGQHIGDLESLSAYDFFQESIAHFQDILEVRPEIIAHDLHPSYLATQWAQRQYKQYPGIRLVGVQHHHAHIASCMAENQLTGQVIGVALDGTGYGTDGQAWGGEVLTTDLQHFQRAAHFAYVPMPGGVQVIHEPWRMAVSYLWQTFGEDWQRHIPASLLASFPSQSLRLVEQLLRGSTRLSLTSSCGRLFDAVAALTLSRTHVTYEAQAAIALEACCDSRENLGSYSFSIREGDCLQMETAPLFVALANDLQRGIHPGIIGRRFHNGLVDVLTTVVCRIAQRTTLQNVCLSGGSFQNAYLSDGLERKLTAAGFTVFTHTQVPPGDGGLSLGQLVIAANQAVPAPGVE